MNSIASWLPITHVMRAIQEPWLGLDDGLDHVAVPAAIGVGSTAGTWFLASRGTP